MPVEKVAIRCDSAGQENYADGSPKRWWSKLAVVENGKEYIGEYMDIHVTKVLQTAAGRMIFGRLCMDREPREAREPKNPKPAPKGSG